MIEKVYITSKQMAKFVCPNCEKSKTVNVSQYADLDKIVKVNVKCPCGHMYTTILEKRKKYRKETKLHGSYTRIVDGKDVESGLMMVRDAGAKKVYFASYSSPLTHPCIYGIDMQTRNEFIAANASHHQVAKKIGADDVIYQDIDDMEQAVRVQNRKIKSFCKACFSGIYPTRDVSSEILKKIEKERETNKARQIESHIKSI